MESAIQREKTIKNRKRAWKIKTIEELNPLRVDLYRDLIWRKVPFAEKQVLDKRMEHLDSGIRRNDEIRDFYPQIFLKSHNNDPAPGYAEASSPARFRFIAARTPLLQALYQ